MSAQRLSLGEAGLGLMLIAVVVVIVLLDVIAAEYEVSPSVLVPLLLAAAGLLSVPAEGPSLMTAYAEQTDPGMTHGSRLL